MDLELPPPGAADWHALVRLSVYPKRSSLSAVHYRLIGNVPKGSRALFTPRELDHPDDMWSVCQSLLLGTEIIINKYC